MADKKISQLNAASVALTGTEVLALVQSGATKQVSIANLTAGRAVSVLTLASTGSGNNTYAGPVGIGGVTPTRPIHAYGIGGVNTAGRIQTASVSGAYMTFDDANTTAELYVRCGAVGNDFVIQAGNAIKARVNSAGNFKFENAGNGIDFSATSDATGMTSELLDDYEEGTFTPTFSCDTGTVTVDTGTRTATYTKVGNKVTINIRMDVSSVSSPTGTLYINGLPFTPASNSAPALMANGFAATATHTIMGAILPSVNYMLLRKYNAGSWATGVAPDTQAGSQLRISCTYFV